MCATIVIFLLIIIINKMYYFQIILILLFISVIKSNATIQPMIGTDATGHTFPGAAYPFGMIQLSPSISKEDWTHASGYHYSDTKIVQFSHTHLSGTGLTDYDDLGLLPLGADISDATFNHKEEAAEAGYYYVYLQDSDVDVELTATKRTGMHRYTWNKQISNCVNIIDNISVPAPKCTVASPRIKLGLNPFGKESSNVNVNIQTIDQSLVLLGSYTRIRDIWANPRSIFFAIMIDHTFTYENQLITISDYETGTPLLVKVAISSVSTGNAYLNLITDNSGWNFDQIVKDNQYQWNQILNHVEIPSLSTKQRNIYDTALYHSCIHPSLFSDVNGEHMGPNNQVQTTDFDYYTLLSTWDVFRSWGNLIALIRPHIYTDIMKSMLHFSEVKGQLPVWTLWDREIEMMIGVHSITLLGIGRAHNLPLNQIKLDRAIETTFNNTWRKLDQFRDRGWIDATRHHYSVSDVLETSYNFYVCGQLHSQPNLADYYGKMGSRYRNVWDPETKLFRGRDSGGNWTPLKDFSDWNGDYAESVPKDMVWFIPHNITDLIELNGGITSTSDRLHNYFFVDTRTSDRIPDNTGVIHHYAHGNENGHHAPYLFNHVNRYDLTISILKQIYGLYTDEPSGIPGNEDAGQMSAWYVLSGLGFHPIDPTSGWFEIGYPLYPEIIFHIDNIHDKTHQVTLHIIRQCDTPTRVTFNNVSLDTFRLHINQIYMGGNLTFHC
jgi:predicted alpha-1,2-mannosidase